MEFLIDVFSIHLSLYLICVAVSYWVTQIQQLIDDNIYLFLLLEQGKIDWHGDSTSNLLLYWQ